MLEEKKGHITSLLFKQISQQLVVNYLNKRTSSQLLEVNYLNETFQTKIKLLGILSVTSRLLNLHLSTLIKV